MEDYSTKSLQNTSIHEKVQHLKDILDLGEPEALQLLNQHNGDLVKAVTAMGSRNHLAASDAGDGVASGEIAAAATASGDSSYAVDNATGTQQVDPIDLTKEGSDQDMQKALMLSMQEMQTSAGGGVVSLEEQELSRALEASLRETTANLSKPMLGLFQDPKNPHKRKRVGKTPVGLKNIGNTCWFSAVIQSLYHIPAFRQKILTYSAPPLPNGTTSLPHCIQFVLELQKIFALLLKSEKMYIDPSCAIQSLQEAFTKEHSHTGAQQDVSEFTHKLLEWIENAFKLSLISYPSESGNPIVKLFNGHFKTEGINNDKPFISESDFGAYPVQVQGHAHLHDSLESATFDTDMQQQTFFTHFPPILVLELSRFQYNQTTRQAEKVHDQLNFEPLLYVDRYLEENKAESCRRKLEVDQLRRKIKELENRLDWYVSYRQKPISITDVLSLTLTFVRDEKTLDEREDSEGAVQPEKRARTSLHPSPRYKSEAELETLEGCLTRWKEELSQDMEDLRASISASKASLEAVYSDPIMNRTPYHLHAVMVHQGEASGGHYWAYTRKHPSLVISSAGETAQSQDVGDREAQSGGFAAWEKPKDSEPDVVAEGSREARSGYHTQLETGEIYADATQSPESMMAGDESSGAAEPSPRECGGVGRGERMEVEGGAGGKEWIKFNDVSVSEVDWGEVQRESVGSPGGNTSAYCLVYLNNFLHHNWLQKATPPSLTPDLQRYVDENNRAFLAELRDHDRTIQTVGHISSDVPIGSEGCPPSPLNVMMSPAASTMSATALPESALPANPRHEERSPQELMQIDSPPAPPVSPTLQTQLTKLVSSLAFHCSQLSKDHDEARPLNILAYATLSHYPKNLVRLLTLNEISYGDCEEKLKMLAKREYIHGLTLLSRDSEINQLDLLKQNYDNFVRLCWFFVEAMKLALDGNFAETLLLCLKACHVHKSIRPQPGASLQGHHYSLLQSLMYKALQQVSSKAYAMFEKGEVKEGIHLANTLIVPALTQLSRESGKEEAVLERVREEWCQCLNRPDLNEREQDQLGDLLTRILDDSGKSLPSALFGSAPINLDCLDHKSLVADLQRLTTQLQRDSFLGI